VAGQATADLAASDRDGATTHCWSGAWSYTGAMFTKIPFTELLKSVPGFFGIRLEEEPKYDVIETLGDVEVRRYAPALIARLTVPGRFEEAVDQAFDRLARYIFGENSGEVKLAMTVPVEQKPEGSVWR
jgi:hypothetical protein